MNPKITDEQREALETHGSPVTVEDDQTHRTYVLIDASLHEQAMQALDEQETRRAIQNGIDDMEAGRVVPFAEVDARIRKRLGLPIRQP